MDICWQFLAMFFIWKCFIVFYFWVSKGLSEWKAREQWSQRHLFRSQCCRMFLMWSPLISKNSKEQSWPVYIWTHFWLVRTRWFFLISLLKEVKQSVMLKNAKPIKWKKKIKFADFDSTMFLYFKMISHDKSFHSLVLNSYKIVNVVSHQSWRWRQNSLAQFRLCFL